MAAAPWSERSTAASPLARLPGGAAVRAVTARLLRPVARVAPAAPVFSGATARVRWPRVLPRAVRVALLSVPVPAATVGAAMSGLRPVVEIMFMGFITLAMDALVNQAAKANFLFGGRFTVPMVLRTPGGSGTGAAAQHSESLENWFVHIPGLKVGMPSNATDAGSLLLAALEDPNPVLVLEHKLLYKQSFEVPDEFPPARLGGRWVCERGRGVISVL